MSEDHHKRRRVVRIGRDRLPESLLSMSMVFADGDRVQVETFDASTMGLGLVVPKDPAFMRDHAAVMLETGSDYKLIGEVVFLIPQGESACRVGVQFTQTIAIEKYLELLPQDA